MLDNSIPYRSWKNKLQMWTMLFGVDKKEQGIIVLLQSLSNNKKVEKTVSNLTSVELYVENGVSLLLEKLDAAFQSEDVEDAYIFLKFSYLKRHCDISMNDIIEFENLNHVRENQTHQRARFQIIR